MQPMKKVHKKDNYLLKVNNDTCFSNTTSLTKHLHYQP